MNGQIDWQAQQISHLVCSLAGQRCSEAWGTFSTRTSQSITALTAWRKEEWRKEAADIPPSKAENDLCSTRQILALFRGQPWGDCWETGRSAYGPFRALRCHLELKLKVCVCALQYTRARVCVVACVRARSCVCVCVCVRERERERETETETETDRDKERERERETETETETDRDKEREREREADRQTDWSEQCFWRVCHVYLGDVKTGRKGREGGKGEKEKKNLGGMAGKAVTNTNQLQEKGKMEEKHNKAKQREAGGKAKQRRKKKQMK